MSQVSSPPRQDTSPGAPEGVRVIGPLDAAGRRVLSDDALAFVAGLERRFRGRRRKLLERRQARQFDIEMGGRPRFLPETESIRAGSWKVAPVPEILRRRKVEITGPVDRKMIVNALNAGADVFMADFEDSSSPTWANMLAGQANLRDAVRREIDFDHPETGKRYALAEETAVLFVRPRGWHLDERHVLVDGEPMSASLFDFGLYFFHNAQELLRRGAGPFFYLPKLEGYREARLWNEVFVVAQSELGIPVGTVKATVLIETILAAFEMDEILYELRDHSAGLNCGRWDYIFSFIKRFRSSLDFVVPDRGTVGMDRHFLRSYSLLLIQTCHKRGVHAIGGMAAQIPIKDDAERNAAALAKVRADKQREARSGHDGTWVAHPALVSIAREEFDAAFEGDDQIERLRDDVYVTGTDLLATPTGAVTEAGLRSNIRVGVEYLEAWLRGQGCVPLYDLMEDAATAEISRAQVWQWLRHRTQLGPDDGRFVDRELVDRVLAEELAAIRARVGEEGWEASRFERAGILFGEIVFAEEFPEFLTSVAYGDL